jgi:hypothetical protein
MHHLEDEGVEDKRLLVVEEEFGSVLKMCQREGNVLSNIVRQAWDGANLQTMTRNPLRATDPHISIVGHTTRDDLLKYLTETEHANGFGNRFLWCSVKRSRLLPNGGALNEPCTSTPEGASCRSDHLRRSGCRTPA